MIRVQAYNERQYMENLISQVSGRLPERETREPGLAKDKWVSVPCDTSDNV